MAIAYMSPSDFVHWVTVEGLPTSGGPVRLRRYVSASASNGGNHTSQDLCDKVLALADTLHTTPKLRNRSRLSMGQGYIQDFIAVWSWMFDNLDAVRELTVQTYLPDDPDAGRNKAKDKLIKLDGVFKAGRPFPDAMHELIAAGCFGWDCIGFVSQYLITIGHLTEYPTWKSNHYISHGKFKPIGNLDNIGPLCIGVFGGWHIVLIDKVYEVSIDERTGTISATVSVCQSYTGGPHTRDQRRLTQARIGTSKDGGNRYGPIVQTGVIDVAAQMVVARHDDIVVNYPPYVTIDEF